MARWACEMVRDFSLAGMSFSGVAPRATSHVLLIGILVSSDGIRFRARVSARTLRSRSLRAEWSVTRSFFWRTVMFAGARTNQSLVGIVLKLWRGVALSGFE